MKRAIVLVAGLTLAAVLPHSVSAASCMVSPTDKSVVSGRFGKFRGGGSANHGSANTKPHAHDGFDFSTSGSSQPVYAASDGVITYIGARGSAGNTIFIERDGGDIIGYYHLAGFASGLAKGSEVKAGQQLGLSGNTPSSSMTKHLHFLYGTTNRDEARFKSFDANKLNSSFDPNSLPFLTEHRAGIGFRTDPAPYFCDDFPIHDGHPAHIPILGATTKEQHAILFGNVPAAGERLTNTDDVQRAAAAGDEVLASAEGKKVESFLSDGDGYGTLPAAPIGDYDSMSPAEMLQTESYRRFVDASWATQLTKVSSRALFADLIQLQAVENNLQHAIKLKSERIEAMMAVYLALKADNKAAIVQAQALMALNQESKKSVGE